MSKRDWLLHAALGLCVVLGVVIGLGIADYADPVPKVIPYGSTAQAKADYESRRSASAPEDAVGWIGRIKRGGEQKTAQSGSESGGESPNLHDALDLEAQWAAAAAAERMARLTVFQIWLSLAGIIAVLLTLRVNYQAAQAALKAAHAAEQQGIDAKKIIDLTEKQFLLTGRQADLAEKVHALERLQYIVDKRPRLLIRHVALTPNAEEGIQAHLIPKGSLVVVNVGGTPARIIDSRYRFYITDRALPMDPPLDDDSTKKLHFRGEDPLDDGESRTYPIEGIQTFGANAEPIRNGRIRLYVMGMIRYADSADKERFIGFCRRYNLPEKNLGEGRFKIINEPDYEFQD